MVTNNEVLPYILCGISERACVCLRSSKNPEACRFDGYLLGDLVKNLLLQGY